MGLKRLGSGSEYESCCEYLGEEQSSPLRLEEREAEILQGLGRDGMARARASPMLNGHHHPIGGSWHPRYWGRSPEDQVLAGSISSVCIPPGSGTSALVESSAEQQGLAEDCGTGQGKC